MIMILFRNYPLSFTGICAPIVPGNEIISLLIMMTYDFHCQICPVPVLLLLLLLLLSLLALSELDALSLQCKVNWLAKGCGSEDSTGCVKFVGTSLVRALAAIRCILPHLFWYFWKGLPHSRDKRWALYGGRLWFMISWVTNIRYCRRIGMREKLTCTLVNVIKLYMK